MGRRARLRFTILAEGKRDYDFARAWLQQRYGKRRIEIHRAQTVAAGCGAGEQNVRQKYPDELAQQRRTGNENRYLVVMIDGDRNRPHDRRIQLEHQAENKGIPGPARRAEDKVLIIVPCRNLETWFGWTDGIEVNEAHDHKSQYAGKGLSPKAYGERIGTQCRPTNAEHRPPSIADACNELNRLPPG